MSNTIVMGPVLSFRGQTTTEKSKGRWKVSAMLVVPTGAAAPVLELEGKALAAPVRLHESPVGDFLRYDLSVPQTAQERRLAYGVKGDPGARWHFTVPASGQTPRMAYVSCNGFSDPKLIKELKTPANHVWSDLLCNHDARLRPPQYPLDREQQWHETVSHAKGVQRFHLLLAGGDQVYMDGVWSEVPELKAWVELDEDEQLKFVPSKKLTSQIEAYFWRTYVQRWSQSPTGKAVAGPVLNAGVGFASMPTVMMWDDHDIFDGWGSYSPAKQRCPLLQTLFRIAREAFWVCQLQMKLADLPTLHDFSAPGSRDPMLQCVKGAVVKGQPPAVDAQAWQAVRKADPLSLNFLDGQAGFNHVLDMGVLRLCVMDLRTNRSQQQVLSPACWQAWHGVWNAMQPQAVTHMLVMSSVPVVHPKLSLVEGPLTFLANDNVTSGSADDLNDHWSHDRHEHERKRLVQALVALGERVKCRVALVSGDVHVAAWGFATKGSTVSNGQRVHQLTSTGVVHPSPSGFAERIFLWYLNQAGRKVQTIDSEHTAQMMNFPNTSDPVMPTRNWLALEPDAVLKAEFDGRPRLWATWRTEQGASFDNHLMAIHPYRASTAALALEAQLNALQLQAKAKKRSG